MWHAGWGGLRCVDMFRGDVLAFAQDGGVTRHHFGDFAAMIRPTTVPGRSIVALEHDVVLWDESENSIGSLARPLDVTGVRLNEGGCAPDGSLLVGSIVLDGSKNGKLFRVASSGEVSTFIGNVGASNGVGFSPDNAVAYYVDSSSGCLDRMTVADDGRLVDRRTLARIEDGSPDGLWVDEQGGIWVAIYGGSRVQRYLPDGKLDEAVRLPTRQVTSCTFGGPDLATLYITTSREHLADDEEPLAGSVFAAPLGVRGLPVLSFGPPPARVTL